MHIIFFDIDGTLATGKTVPESAKKAVNKLRKNGDLVFLCTGRNINYVRSNFSEYADGFICNNGRLAWFNGEVIFDAPIGHETRKTITERLDEAEAAYVFYGKTHGFWDGPDGLYDLLSAGFDPGYLIRGFDENVDEFYNFDIFFYDSDHYERIRQGLEGLCIFNPHGPHPSADVTVIGTDKGDAIRAVADKLNVDIADTYAFGDGINDIFMMKAAGHGIAMGNALDSCKEAADYITSHIDDDGIYNGLKHYKLI